MTKPRLEGSQRALTHSFYLLGLAALLIVLVGFVSAKEPADFWLTHLGTLAVVAGYFAVGGWAWLRRPGNSMGFLTVAAGFTLLLGVLSDSSIAALALAGSLFSLVTVAISAQLLLGFPDGRLATWPARIVTVAVYIAALCFQSPAVFAYLGIQESAAGWLDLLRIVLGVTVAVFALGSAGILVSRWIRASPQTRSALLPFYLYGAVAIVAVSYLPALLPPSQLLYHAQLLVLFSIPVVFAWTALRGRFSKAGEINSLGAALGASWEVPGDLSSTLAGIFGDVEARVVFWSEEQQGFLTYDGNAVPAPPEYGGPDHHPHEDFARLTLRHQGVLVGAILFRPQIVIDVALVHAAAQVLLLAVERGQLTAQLKANQTQLHDSRLRLLNAADTERARIAQNLHDGVQAHLVLLTMEAGTLINDLERASDDSRPLAGSEDVASRLRRLRHNIDLAAGELRELVYDVMPPLLLERDLSDALEVLTDRVPLDTTLTVADSLRWRERELPNAVLSTVYFIVAESLTNAIKHSQATAIQVDVTLDHGELVVTVTDNGNLTSIPEVVGNEATRFGLRSLRDRVETLGGQFHLRTSRALVGATENPAATFPGLSVQAVIPCAW